MLTAERLRNPLSPLTGAVLAIAATLLMRTVAGTRLLAEVAVDASTYGLQPRGFSFLLSQLGPAGKPLLFVCVILGEVCLYLIAWRLAAWIGGRRGVLLLITCSAGIAAAMRLIATALLVGLTVPTLGSETSWSEYVLVSVLAAAVFATTSVAIALPSAVAETVRPKTATTSRRELLIRLPLFALGAGSLLLILRQVLRSTGGGAQTSHAGHETPEVTSNKDYYIVSKNLFDPTVDEKQWALRVGGLVASPLRFSLDDILSLPAIDQYTTMQCISNEVGGDLFSNALWRGIPLRDFVDLAQPDPKARYIGFRSADDYTESLPLDFARQDGVMLAHTMNGVPLPDKHGFPLRLLAPGKYGMKHPKWIIEVAFFDTEFLGYWEQRGWSQECRMNTSCRIDVPAPQAVIMTDSYHISGIAFAGNRGISRVEVSVDGGETWNDAALKPALSPYSWALWHYDWVPITVTGRVKILARATDGTGELQTAETAPPYPSGATGYPFVPAVVRPAI